MLTKQNILIGVALLLGAIYLYAFTDWLSPRRIQIIAQTRPFRPAASTARVYPVSFVLDGTYRLTSVKVVLLSAFETNKFTSPLWELVRLTNAEPTKGFLYGDRIPGMRDKQSNSAAQPLQPNTAYRLLIKSGRAVGQADFRTSGELGTENQ
jgi:hypothetical protein